MKPKQDTEGMDIADFAAKMNEQHQATQEQIKAIKAETAELRRKTKQMAKQCEEMKAAYKAKEREIAAERTEITYYEVNNFNVTADLPSRNIHLYLWWWNMEEAKKPDFEQQLDLICHIGRTIEDIIRHMRINGHEVDYVPTDEVEG